MLAGETAAGTHPHLGCDQEGLQIQREGRRLWDEVAVRVSMDWMCARPSQSVLVTHTQTGERVS